MRNKEIITVYTYHSAVSLFLIMIKSALEMEITALLTAYYQHHVNFLKYIKTLDKIYGCILWG